MLLDKIPEDDLTTTDRLALKAQTGLRNSRLKERLNEAGHEAYLDRRGDGYYVMYSAPPSALDLRPREFRSASHQGICYAICQCCQTSESSSYMVLNDIWKVVAPDRKGIMCLACVSERLGRPLTQQDFDLEIPININVLHLPES